MADLTTPLPLTSSRADEIFPSLITVQIERVATHGRRRVVRNAKAASFIGAVFAYNE